MNFTATAALGTLVFTLLNLFKYARVMLWPDGTKGEDGKAKETRWDGFNGVLTLLIGYAAGIAAVFVVAQTQFASDIKFGQQSLAQMSGWSLFFIGLIATSALSTVNEVKKAIDPSDSAKTPPLLRGTTEKKVPATTVVTSVPTHNGNGMEEPARHTRVPVNH